MHTHSVHDYLLARGTMQGLSAEERKQRRLRNRHCVTGRQACAESVWSELRALYREEVRNLDVGFGRLVDVLAERGMWDSTLLVLTSDHGEGFEPERRRIHHGGRLHEDQVRIPLLVRGPGVEPGRIPEPVSLVDLVPTLLEWIGAAPGAFDGRSLAPLLRGGELPEADRDRTLWAMEHSLHWVYPGGRGNVDAVEPFPIALAAVRGPHWYILARGMEGTTEELYDMRADPRQRRNLAGAASTARDGLRARTLARARERPATAPVEPDADLRDQLRALGYVE